MWKLSNEAQYLWAKKSKEGTWLPLVIHMLDSASIAKHLWNMWIPIGLKSTIIDDLVKPGCSSSVNMDIEGEKLVVFLAMIHDLGKATPVFQAKESTFPPSELDKELMKFQLQLGMSNHSNGSEGFTAAKQTPHALVTACLLEEYAVHRNIAAIVGAHHGKPLSSRDLLTKGPDSYPQNYYFGKQGKNIWQRMQKELFHFCVEKSGIEDYINLPIPGMKSQVLFSGLLIMIDWLVSNEKYFPYFEQVLNWSNIFKTSDHFERVKVALSRINLPTFWSPGLVLDYREYFANRFSNTKFSFSANNMQILAAELASSVKNPGIFIIEAPMGHGKTEAALAISEIFANLSMRSGLFFALPTQATTDSIFKRVDSWARKVDEYGSHSIKLFHSRAQFNPKYSELYEGSKNYDVDNNDPNSRVFVHQWFEGSKRALLADFVVGTIDQLLMASLKHKHVMLRHLGLAGKVVIVDECHAYDAYMSEYLSSTLTWLGAYGVPVIVLSATLPSVKRKELVNAYLGTSESMQSKAPCENDNLYPLLTWTDNGEVQHRQITNEAKQKEIIVQVIDEELLIKEIERLAKHGGCIGVIRNTVKSAQQVAKILQDEYGESVQLLHSRFLAVHRMELEEKITGELGKTQENRPRFCITVGTQVLEQSLDIDFDVLFTDLCPMDLLIQRMGRLHRHERERPAGLEKAKCYVMNANVTPAAESVSIYGNYLLLKTQILLPDKIQIPNDIPLLVNQVYENHGHSLHTPELAEALEKHKSFINNQKQRAKTFRINQIWRGDVYQNLTGWLDTEISEKKGEATVRDTDESIEVIVMKKTDSGTVTYVRSTKENTEFSTNLELSAREAKEIAKQRIRLPSVLCSPWNIEKTIEELENITKNEVSYWQTSAWLNGELFFFMDESGSAELAGYLLKYDPFLGLLYEKRRETHGGESL